MSIELMLEERNDTSISAELKDCQLSATVAIEVRRDAHDDFGKNL
jgi:hypothetical protein